MHLAAARPAPLGPELTQASSKGLAASLAPAADGARLPPSPCTADMRPPLRGDEGGGTCMSGWLLNAECT